LKKKKEVISFFLFVCTPKRKEKKEKKLN